MPAKSKSQFRYMEMSAHDPKKAKKEDLSAPEASEYTSENKGKLAYDNLPEKLNKFSKIKALMKANK